MRSIPSYELYGDFLAGHVPDPIHHETIKERSSKHNWTIRVHRHRHLAQIFLFRSSGVFFSLGDMEHTTAQPVIVVVPPGTPHGFRFSEDVVGDVVSVRLTAMPQALLDRFAMFQSPTSSIFREGQSNCFEKVAELVRQLSEVYGSIGQGRSAIMASLVDLISLYLIRDMPIGTAAELAPKADFKGQKRDQHIELFCSLLEENFHRSWTVAEYADRVGLSAPQLTRICRANLAAPPNDLVRQRRILEAKRLLEYSKLSIAEIAHRTGFKDAAFFCRSFKDCVGCPPNTYRQGLDRG